uniref:Uncharacterized protein n=1 Tax=Brassica oleracea var. oleracea TaxID=109376 RepID=A0A0D3CSV0_BRAOL
MEIPPRDQTRLGERRGGIGRREKGSKVKKKVNSNDGTIAAPSDTVKGKGPSKTSLHEDRRWLRSIDRQNITSIDRSPLNCVDRQSFKSIESPLNCVCRHSHQSQEPMLASNTKPDSTTCLGAWYTWDRFFKQVWKDFLDVDCNILEVMILNFKSCEPLLFSNLFQRDCSFVLLEDKQKGSWTIWKKIVILVSFGALLSVELHTRSFELDFQCRRFEVNQYHVAEVMPVLLKSDQSASREEAVEEMKDYRSMKQHWCRSMSRKLEP